MRDPQGPAHYQAALNETVDDYNFYVNQGYNPANPDALSGYLDKYDRLQNGVDPDHPFLAPMTHDDVPSVATKQWMKDAPKYAAEQIIMDKAAGVVGKGILKALPKGEPKPEIGPSPTEPEGPPAGGSDTLEGDPISVATGEYVETWRDLHVPTVLALDGSRYMGLNLELPREYISPLGPCQISMFDEAFSNPEPGKLHFHQADGECIRFKRPFNFLSSRNACYPHLDLRSPWLKRLEIRDRSIVKHFSQYADDIYRLDMIEDLNGNSVALTRDEAGRLVRAESTDGLALAFDNDVRGYRTAITLIGTDGTRLELAFYRYDAQGRMVEADCSFGMSVRYAWDGERNLLLSWKNTTGRSETHFTYDEAGRVIRTRTNGIWNGDSFRYDSEARETTYLPGGNESLIRRFRYDTDNNVTHEIDALGGTTVHVFNAAGFRTSTTDPNGHTSSTTHDVRGNVKFHVDAEGHRTTFNWDTYGGICLSIDGKGNRFRCERDERGNISIEEDAEGNTSRYTYNENGQIVRLTFADGTEESRSYDAYRRLIRVVDARGDTTHFSYDAFGRIIATIDASGGTTRAEYQAGAGGFATPSAIVRPDNVRISRAYAEDGALTSVTDGEGRTRRYVYGAFDLLQAVDEPGGGRLSFSYDCKGRMITITNQLGATYDLSRDAAGRVIVEDDFDGRRTEYIRDSGGRPIETKKPDGTRLSYAYDRTGKLISVKGYAADDAEKTRPLAEAHYWYDKRGLLIRASNLAALVEFERDGNGLIVAEVVNGHRIESKRDVRGNRIERRTSHGGPGGGLVRYAYDPLGLFSEFAINEHAPLVLTRGALGRETHRSSNGGFFLNQGWDAVGQLVTQNAGRNLRHQADSTAVHVFSARAAGRQYDWNEVNAPVGLNVIIWGETSYMHDANGQVVDTIYKDGREAFAYDSGKNIVGIRVQGPEIGPDLEGLLGWQASPGGMVKLARGPNGEMVALSHDACGRIVARRIDRKGFRPKTWRYGWDVHDRLVTCETPEGDLWHYSYDPIGRRVAKVRKLRQPELAWAAAKFPALVSSTSRHSTKIWVWPEQPTSSSPSVAAEPPAVGTYFFWDGDVIAEEAPLRLDGSINWDKKTSWFFEPNSFLPLAKHTADGSLYYFVNDHIGTPREMFDENGELQWAVFYTTWGSLRSWKSSKSSLKSTREAIFPKYEVDDHITTQSVGNFSPSDCPIRFQGQWYDQESDLHYNRYRHYDAITATYVSCDPVGLFGGARLHGYVGNPTAWVDPYGLFAKGPRPIPGGGKPLGQPGFDEARTNLGGMGIKLNIGQPGKGVLGNPKALGAFKSDTETVYVPSNASRYVVRHETIHAEQYRKIGKNAYDAQSPTQKEQYVYDQLKNSGWMNGEMNATEIAHAKWYIQDQGGIP